MPNIQGESPVRKMEHGSCFSANLVKFLKEKKGMTLKKIGQMAGGLSESFISRVANRKSNFTCDHLARIEESMGQPLAFLLINATPRELIPKDMKGLHDEIMLLLQKSGDLGTHLKKTK